MFVLRVKEEFNRYRNLIKEPLKNIPSMIFMALSIFGLIELFLSFITDIFTIPFIIASIVTSLLAIWYIGVIGTLRENLDNMEKSINELKENNDHLHKELIALEKLRKNLEIYAQENNQEFKSILEKVNSSFERLERITRENERTLLYRIAQDLEFVDNKSGMSRDEYKRFIQRIPNYLRDRFEQIEKRDFNEIAKSDNKIDYRELDGVIKEIIKR
jgi:cell shape-determining protein MreC